MARRRMIDPDFWDDEELCVDSINPFVDLFYIASWNFADDYGVINGSSMWLKSKIFPYRKVDVEPIIKQLVAMKKYIAFQSEGKTWFYIKNFKKTQKVEKPSQKKNPTPPENILSLPDSSPTPTQIVASEYKLSKEKISKDKLSKEKDTFSSINDLKESVLIEISTKYNVPLAFVKSKVDDMTNWHNENPLKNKKANWKATLMNWVKKDALKIMTGQPVNKLGVTKIYET